LRHVKVICIKFIFVTKDLSSLDEAATIVSHPLYDYQSVVLTPGDLVSIFQMIFLSKIKQRNRNSARHYGIRSLLNATFSDFFWSYCASFIPKFTFIHFRYNRKQPKMQRSVYGRLDLPGLEAW